MTNIDRFRFRAWLVQEEKIVDVDELFVSTQSNKYLRNYYRDNLISYHEFNDCNKCRERKYSTHGNTYLLQCTGLKDKNDKLIYEGDIVEYGDSFGKGMHLVQYCSNNDYPAFDLNNHSEEYNLISHALIDPDSEIEIIGNIYQTPNLLNDSK